MEGFFTKAAHVSSNNATNFVGILYAEDFDEPADLDLAARRGESPPPPAITQADVDAACAAAVHAARLDWQVGQEHARTNAITSLNTVLRGMHETAERTTLAVAEGTVTTILAMVAGLLPYFAREHGPTEVRALLGRLLPTIRSPSRISVRVHADLIALLQRDLIELDADIAATVDVIAAPLERGDVKSVVGERLPDTRTPARSRRQSKMRWASSGHASFQPKPRPRPRRSPGQKEHGICRIKWT